jgi:hypothetical protein
MERESIVFYRSFYEAISQLQDPQTKVEIYDAVFEYGLNGVDAELTGIAGALFTAFKPQIEANNKRYANGLKGAEFGKRGGRPKKSVGDKDKNPIGVTDKNPKETPKKPQKETYGTGGNVKLTIAEYERLVADYGADKTNKAIELLDGYIADKGYKSKDNNRALRRWVFDAVEEQEQKRAKINGGGNIRPVDVFFADQMQEVKERGIF